MINNNLSKYYKHALCYVFILLISILSGCATNKPQEPIWPNELPPRAYFLDQYQQDLTNKKIQDQEEYLSWIVRFYKGSDLYPNGWNNITQDIVFKLKNSPIAENIKVKLDRLGLLISEEWAKNNKTRMISSYHVSVWGNALLKSLEQSETLQLIDRVASDVDDLLARKIPAEIIVADRYYVQDEEML
jgi:hypothetical protein